MDNVNSSCKINQYKEIKTNIINTDLFSNNEIINHLPSSLKQASCPKFTYGCVRTFIPDNY